MNYIARASGATLGFITAGIPGAIAGEELTRFALMKRKATQWSIRKRRRTRAPAFTKKSKMWMRSRNRGGKRNIRTKTYKKQLGLRTPKLKWKRRIGGKKFVKVGKRLRRAIRQSTYAQKPRGFIEYVNWDNISTSVTKGTQVAAAILESKPTDGSNGWLFTPTIFMEAASTLFNGYQPGTAWATNTTILDAVSGGLKNNILNPNNTSFYVKKSWARVCLKNVGYRLMQIKLYICHPKFTGEWVSTNSVPGPYDPSKTMVPLGMWNKFLGNSVTNVPWGTSPYNPLVNTPNTIYADPRAYAHMNHYYKFEQIKLDLAPGQCWDFIVPGPQDFVFNSSTYLSPREDGTYEMSNIQKFSRYVFLTMVPDIIACTGDSGALAAYPYPAADVADNLIVETRQYYNIRCPENAGFYANNSIPVGNASYPMNYRQQVNAMVIQTDRTISTPVFHQTLNGGVSSSTNS